MSDNENDKISINSLNLNVIKNDLPNTNNKFRSISPNANIDIGLDLLVNKEKQKPIKIDEKTSNANGYNLNENNQNISEFDLLEDNNQNYNEFEIKSNNTINNSIISDQDFEDFIDKQDMDDQKFYNKDLKS